MFSFFRVLKFFFWILCSCFGLMFCTFIVLNFLLFRLLPMILDDWIKELLIKKFSGIKLPDLCFFNSQNDVGGCFGA